MHGRHSRSSQPYAALDGLRLHYLEWGAPDASALVLLHALGALVTAHDWDGFAAAVQGTHRVIAPDRRGSGLSDWSASTPRWADAAGASPTEEPSPRPHGLRVSRHWSSPPFEATLATKRALKMDVRVVAKRLEAATRGIGRPVDYSRRTAYRRPPALYRRLQWLGVLLTSLGLVPEFVVVLEVRGRRSGKPRRTVVVRAAHEGDYYLVALAGESEWVRNVRAAAGKAVIRHRGARRVGLVEVPLADRPPIIRAYLQRPGWSNPSGEARHYFGLRQDASLEEIRPIVDRYPVFRIVDLPLRRS